MFSWTEGYGIAGIATQNCSDSCAFRKPYKMPVHALTHSPQSSTNRLQSKYYSRFLLKCVGCSKLPQFVCFVILPTATREHSIHQPHATAAFDTYLPVIPMWMTGCLTAAPSLRAVTKTGLRWLWSGCVCGGGGHTAKQDPSHGPHGVCVSSTQFQFNGPVRWLPAIRTLTHFH